MSYSFFPSPTHAALLTPTSRPAVTEPAHLSHSPSPRNSVLMPSHLRLGSRDLDKLLSKAAKLEAHLMHEPVNVHAYRRKWYADYQAKSVPTMKAGQGRLLPQIKGAGRQLSPTVIQTQAVRGSPERTVGNTDERGNVVVSRRLKIRRKQSEQEIDLGAGNAVGGRRTSEVRSASLENRLKRP